jgi:hypothetical protein
MSLTPFAVGTADQKRFMVVEIGYDPSKVSAEELRAWEEGEKGEIFS